MKRKPPHRKARRFTKKSYTPSPEVTKFFFADDRQVGGNHYKTDDPAQQHWNLVVAKGWDYFTGQITKYLFRWPEKGRLDDLRKARHFLDKLIELVERGWSPTQIGSEAWRHDDPAEPGKGYIHQD